MEQLLLHLLTLITKVVVELYSYLIIVRFLLQLFRADFYHPVAQQIIKTTNPILLPLRRYIPGLFGIDLASILALLTLSFVKLAIFGAVLAMPGYPTSVGGIVIGSISESIGNILDVYSFIVILQSVLILITPNGNHPWLYLLVSITDPVLQPLRKRVPPLGIFDSAILLLLLIIYLIRIIVVAGLWQYASRL